jgi:hypothetical protein
VVHAHAVSAFVDQVTFVHHEVHALIHNSGALYRNFGLADDGAESLTERTLATHFLAPLRLSLALAPLLVAQENRSSLAASGGMYTQAFALSHRGMAAAILRRSFSAFYKVPMIVDGDSHQEAPLQSVEVRGLSDGLDRLHRFDWRGRISHR